MLRNIAGLAVFMAMQGCQNIKPLRCLNLLQKVGEKLSLHVRYVLHYFLGFTDDTDWVSQCFSAFRHATRGNRTYIQRDSVLCLILFCSFGLENIRQKKTIEHTKVGPSDIMKLDFLSHQTWLKIVWLMLRKAMVTSSKLFYSCFQFCCCSELLSFCLVSNSSARCAFLYLCQ